MIAEREIAKLFTSNCLNAVASNDFFALKKLKIYEIANQYNAQSFEDLYENAYKTLSKNYRNEYIYKNIIARNILLGRHSLNSSVLLSEYRVGTNKADLVLLNGCSTCYEIKTEYDSLVRLNDQLSSYLKLFDKVNVVCSYQMLESVLHLAPIEVGVIVLTDTNTLKTIREPIETELLDIELMMKSLRKNEYQSIAEKLYQLKIDVPNTRLYELCEKIIKSHDPKLIKKEFLSTLKITRKNNANAINSLPNSLTNALISFKFKPNDIQSLIKIFSEKQLNVLSNFKGETE
ncbi:sce7726 family protein [Acinetobacter sp.]|uniref:sce7726 family protein n=1 Tax=Acinetobacter sp. TaxID=472 RepID=UPI0026491018|nr:sce7726 family protein [Acinetobacter sp.]MDN5526136.1 sce7726 family protein [Acinetobacter sp.]